MTAGHRNPSRKEPVTADVLPQTAIELRREAGMRGIGPDELIARCLDNIAKDNLFHAILD